MSERLTFYPDLQPFNRGRLRVSKLHEIYFEECGNPGGKPAVVLHGGPGGGISPFLRQSHDPKAYRIILFDQRGCGQSTPHAELAENTTWDLVADMEKLRQHLKIGRWQVVGGSWGSTLALAYAETHPERVTELITRGIFTLRRSEIRWFYQEGADQLFPDLWEGFIAPIPPEERHDLLFAYHSRLTGSDKAQQIACARAWSQWEGATLSLLPDPKRVAEFGSDHFAIAFARIESHYFVNGGFFRQDDQLIADARKLAGIPGVIIQGRYDVVTPPATAWDLHKAWPEAEFIMVPDAGHTATEPGIADALVRATNRFRHA
ncbi:prolyl aminopeptidase [Aestuariivirga sp.]|uniref:prolyl aminopeptidase n=1 Tax=Aestuariivirga sp. TaxID=2650926 RepID=UPI0025C0DA4F|nr:prolyl aminopeptidase [Aestuariivirga sp.]MCA3555358.1 prolyl aminopeptidase [Aestuariivirga sp.]